MKIEFEILPLATILSPVLLINVHKFQTNFESSTLERVNRLGAKLPINEQLKI